MQRAIWKGTVSFGMITIPVRLFNAVRRKTVNFHQLRAADGCRVHYKKVCSADGAEVDADNIVKGVETAPDQYIAVSDEELASLYPRPGRNIEIQSFVPPDQIDPLYYSQAYYLLPDTGAAKTYDLLLAALGETGRVAIVRFVLRNREHLAALRPAGRLLNLSTMYFTDEIIQWRELAEEMPAGPELPERELAMAEQLVESLSADFTPQKYTDKYRRLLMELIERKAAGQEIAARPAVSAGAGIIDLTAALEASLAAARKKTAKPARKKSHAR